MYLLFKRTEELSFSYLKNDLGFFEKSNNKKIIICKPQLYLTSNIYSRVFKLLLNNFDKSKKKRNKFIPVFSSLKPESYFYHNLSNSFNHYMTFFSVQKINKLKYF